MQHDSKFTAEEAAGLVRDRLLSLADPKYKAFSEKLIPTVAPERILGVRTPQLRALAKELRGTEAASAFLRALPHRFQEENALHAFLLAYEKDYARCLALLNAFLPFVDNWAVCDVISLPCFRRHHAELLDRIPIWLASDQTYTLRFGIKMLMDHFLEEDFSPACPAMVAALRSEEYYVNMMRAWYFATVLAKQWDAVLPWLTEPKLDRWTHNKSIQKAVESNRITAEQKTLLRTLRLSAVRPEQ